MNAEAIKKDSEAIADDLCQLIGQSKCSPLHLADKTLDDPNLTDEGKAKVLYALVLAAQIIAEEAFRVAALALLAKGGEPECPCEKCQAVREAEKEPVQ